MILKLIVSPDGIDSVVKRVSSLLGHTWVSHNRVVVNPRFHKPGSEYDFYWEGGFWNDDKHFDDIVLHEDAYNSLVVTMYVYGPGYSEVEDDDLRDAQSLLEGLPHP